MQNLKGLLLPLSRGGRRRCRFKSPALRTLRGSAEVRKRERKTRGTRGGAHPRSRRTVAAEIRPAAELGVAGGTASRGGGAHWWSSSDGEEQLTCSSVSWSSPWCRLAPGAPRRRIEDGPAASSARRLGPAAQAREQQC
jgi:hypothetical protein